MSDVQNQLPISEVMQHEAVASAPQVPLAMHLPKAAMANIRKRASKIRSVDAAANAALEASRRSRLIRQIIARG